MAKPFRNMEKMIFNVKVAFRKPAAEFCQLAKPFRHVAK